MPVQVLSATLQLPHHIIALDTKQVNTCEIPRDEIQTGLIDAGSIVDITFDTLLIMNRTQPKLCDFTGL